MKKEIFTPGRTELAGNHTDHQKGRILASGVDLGLYAACTKNDERIGVDGCESQHRTREVC